MSAQTKKRMGRPPLPPEQRTTVRPRSVRLDDVRWSKLQRLGREWLERTIDAALEIEGR